MPTEVNFSHITNNKIWTANGIEIIGVFINFRLPILQQIEKTQFQAL